jgi:hypothetical protein
LSSFRFLFWHVRDFYPQIHESKQAYAQTPRNPDRRRESFKIISFQVDAAIRWRWFSESERDDLNQQLAILLIHRSSSFDPSIASWPTFVKMVSRRELACQAYRARHRKLNRPECGSLNQACRDKDGKSVELGDQLEQEVANNRKGTKPRSESSHFELRHDIEAVLPLLTVEQSQFCKAFLKTESISESSIECSVVRSTVYRRIRKVRETFKEHEIHRHRQ